MNDHKLDAAAVAAQDAELRKHKIGEDRTEEEIQKIREIDYNPQNTEWMMEHYSRFLHDGDFEQYMPVIFMQKDSIEYLKMQIELQREKVRLLWLETRFTKFYSNEWAQVKSLYVTAHSYLRLMEGELEKRETGKYTMKPANIL